MGPGVFLACRSRQLALLLRLLRSHQLYSSPAARADRARRQLPPAHQQPLIQHTDTMQITVTVAETDGVVMVDVSES